MSNYTHLYNPPNNSLAVPAALPIVYVDGRCHDGLVVVRIERNLFPAFSTCVLTYRPAGSAVTCRDIGNASRRLTYGKSITIRQTFDSGIGASVPCEITIFAGTIESVTTKMDSKDVSLEIVARDYSVSLERKQVRGRHLYYDADNTPFIDSVRTVFNEGGVPNMSAELLFNGGRHYNVFASNNTVAQSWTPAQILYYLLCEYTSSNELAIPSLPELQGLTTQVAVNHLDITGLAVTAAISKCCQVMGLSFRFTARSSETDPSQRVVFWRQDRGRKVPLAIQPVGEQLDISKTMTADYRAVTGPWPATHRFTAFGSKKVFEATFELVQAWDKTKLSDDARTFSQSLNPDFLTVRDVWRKWCLNEAGDYSEQPYDCGAAADLSAVFENDPYLLRHRHIEPMLTCDNQGRSLGTVFEVSYDSGSSWQKYTGSYEILEDEFGVWVSDEEFPIDYWLAAFDGQLRARITASIASDSRLRCSWADGPLDSAAPVFDHMVNPVGRFEYRKLTDFSAYADAVSSGLFKADQIDDSLPLRDAVIKEANRFSPVIGSVDIDTLYITTVFEPGDHIGSTNSDRRYLPGLDDDRTYYEIENVTIDYIEQRTHLKLSRRKKQFK